MVNSQALQFVPGRKFSNVRYARRNVSCTRSPASSSLPVRRRATAYRRPVSGRATAPNWARLVSESVNAGIFPPGNLFTEVRPHPGRRISCATFQEGGLRMKLITFAAAAAATLAACSSDRSTTDPTSHLNPAFSAIAPASVDNSGFYDHQIIEYQA